MRALAAASFVLWLMVSGACAQERWVRLTRAEEELIEVDQTSIRRDGLEVRAQIRSSLGPTLQQRQWLRIHCDSATMQIVQSTIRDTETGRESEDTSDATRKTPMQPPYRYAAGSRGAQIVSHLCERSE